MDRADHLPGNVRAMPSLERTGQHEDDIYDQCATVRMLDWTDVLYSMEFARGDRLDLLSGCAIIATTYKYRRDASQGTTSAGDCSGYCHGFGHNRT
jgi:hypothetical protein